MKQFRFLGASMPANPAAGRNEVEARHARTCLQIARSRLGLSRSFLAPASDDETYTFSAIDCFRALTRSRHHQPTLRAVMSAAYGREEISSRAQTGFAKSDAYDANRPAYSDTIVQLLLENVGVAGKKGARLLDLAAGTGKLTEALASRAEQYEIIAVEPHSDMRRVLAAKQLPRVSIMDGTGESMPGIEDGTIEAVLVAQGFHWFANMTALKEIHRVLQRHSALGLVWNAEDWNSPRDHKATTPWEVKAHDLTWRIADEIGDNVPRFRHMQWPKVFDEQVKKTPLSLIIATDDQMFSLPIAEHQEPFEVALTSKQAWDRYSTLGHIAALESDHQEQVHAQFMDAISEADMETGDDEKVIVHGTTYAYWTTKIPEEGRDGLEEDPEAEPVGLET